MDPNQEAFPVARCPGASPQSYLHYLPTQIDIKNVLKSTSNRHRECRLCQRHATSRTSSNRHQIDIKNVVSVNAMPPPCDVDVASFSSSMPQQCHAYVASFASSMPRRRRLILSQAKARSWSDLSLTQSTCGSQFEIKFTTTSFHLSAPNSPLTVRNAAKTTKILVHGSAQVTGIPSHHLTCSQELTSIRFGCPGHCLVPLGVWRRYGPVRITLGIRWPSVGETRNRHRRQRPDWNICSFSRPSTDGTGIYYFSFHVMTFASVIKLHQPCPNTNP